MIPSTMAFDHTVHWGNMSVDSGHPQTRVCILLKRLKTDQFGRGTAVFLGVTGDELCPVVGILLFIALWENAASPFFFLDSIPLTKSHFVAHVCEAMVRAGILTQNYSRHFHISVAMVAAKAGLQDSTIQVLEGGPATPFTVISGGPRIP